MYLDCIFNFLYSRNAPTSIDVNAIFNDTKKRSLRPTAVSTSPWW